MTKTLTDVRDQLSREMHDYLHSTVTTALTTNTSVIDTTLVNKQGGATTDYFKNWWVFVTSAGNASMTPKRVSAYNASTYTLTVQGAFSTNDDPTKATYELHKYSPVDKLDAINVACRKIYPVLYRDVFDLTTVTGSNLPDGHFEWWTSSSASKFYSGTSATLGRTSTAGLIRGGVYSAKVTVSAANGYMGISSTNYPRLLDLKDLTVSFYAWAYPEVANDAWIQIYTLQADGTAQTLTSTTVCPAGKWTLLALEDQKLNDKLVQIDFRWGVTTDTKYAYFDNSRVTGRDVYDYVLPSPLQTNGRIFSVRLQTTGAAREDPCDDIGFNTEFQPIRFTTFYDGTYRWLRPLVSLSSAYLLELRGIRPLEDTATANADVITVEDPHTELLVNRATKECYSIQRGQVSSQSTDFYEKEIARLDREYGNIVGRLAMPSVPVPVRWT